MLTLPKITSWCIVTWLIIHVTISLPSSARAHTHIPQVFTSNHERRRDGTSPDHVMSYLWLGGTRNTKPLGGGYPCREKEKFCIEDFMVSSPSQCVASLRLQRCFVKNSKQRCKLKFRQTVQQRKGADWAGDGSNGSAISWIPSISRPTAILEPTFGCPIPFVVCLVLTALVSDIDHTSLETRTAYTSLISQNKKSWSVSCNAPQRVFNKFVTYICATNAASV